MLINKSVEDYLEAVLILNEKLGYARSVDIADHLSVTKPSVSYAVKNLRENGYIEVASDGLISLTGKGLPIAEAVYERHRVLTDFFIGIGVDPEIAQQDACKIEHDLNPETFEALCRHAGVR